MHEHDVITPAYTCNTHHCDSRATIYQLTYGTSKSAAVDDKKVVLVYEINDAFIIPRAVNYVSPSTEVGREM
jgi:hypothetical protein